MHDGAPRGRRGVGRFGGRPGARPFFRVPNSRTRGGETVSKRIPRRTFARAAGVPSRGAGRARRAARGARAGQRGRRVAASCPLHEQRPRPRRAPRRGGEEAGAGRDVHLAQPEGLGAAHRRLREEHRREGAAVARGQREGAAARDHGGARRALCPRHPRDQRPGDGGALPREAARGVLQPPFHRPAGRGLPASTATTSPTASTSSPSATTPTS